MIAAHQHGFADRNMRMCPPNTSVRILTGRNFDNIKSEFLPAATVPVGEQSAQNT